MCYLTPIGQLRGNLSVHIDLNAQNFPLDRDFPFENRYCKFRPAAWSRNGQILTPPITFWNRHRRKKITVLFNPQRPAARKFFCTHRFERTEFSPSIAIFFSKIDTSNFDLQPARGTDKKKCPATYLLKPTPLKKNALFIWPAKADFEELHLDAPILRSRIFSPRSRFSSFRKSILQI